MQLTELVCRTFGVRQAMLISMFYDGKAVQQL